MKKQSRTGASKTHTADVRFLLGRSDLPCEILKFTITEFPDKMVLESDELETPTRIVGRPCEHWFKGHNEAPDKLYEIMAKWARVGDTYVGTWIEQDREYLFSFQLGT